MLKARQANTTNPRASLEALQDIFWAYLNSSEFILVH
jgi:hypothetical protein